MESSLLILEKMKKKNKYILIVDEKKIYIEAKYFKIIYFVSNIELLYILKTY